MKTTAPLQRSGRARPAPRLLAVPALLAALAAPPGLAQEGLSGSENHVATGRSTLSGGSRSTSASFAGEIAIGNGGWNQKTSSPSFTATSGVVLAKGPIGDGPPLFFGTVPGLGDKGGGTNTTGFGFALQSPGAGFTQVLFGGTPATNVMVTTNTTVTLTTPQGTNSFGNPLAITPVAVFNGLGISAVADGFNYLPSLTTLEVARLGQDFTMTLTTQTASLAILSIGFPVAGIALPIPGLDGSLELLANLSIIGPLSPILGGELDYEFQVPNDPNLVGKTAPFQAVAIDSLNPLDGSFTNVLNVTILP